MKKLNPAIVLRSHLAQRTADAAVDEPDFEPRDKLVEGLGNL